jgi:predicted lipid carrier protein YhbT
MQKTTEAPPPTTQPVQPLLARQPIFVPLLAERSGRMRVDVAGCSAGVIEVDQGHINVSDQLGEVGVIAIVHEASDFLRLLRGELDPVVASIQGRLLFQGDVELGVEIILALNTAKPFASAEV